MPCLLSPRIVQPEAQRLGALEIAVAHRRRRAIIIACQDVEPGGKELGEYKVHIRLPLHTRPLITGQIIQTGLQFHSRDDGPLEIGLHLRTEIMLHRLAFLQAIAGLIYLRIAHVTHRVSQRSQKDGEIELGLIQLVVHTDTG